MKVVRYHLEYANTVWNSHRQGQIKDLERSRWERLSWLWQSSICLIRKDL